MSYILVIVESPAKCDKIEKFLGPGYKCLASYGHLTQLPSLKNIDFKNNFEPTFEIMESKKPQIAKLRKAIKGATEVILATDDDREGEAIAWHICKLFNLSVITTKRIIFNEITETAIKTAIKTPTIINLHLVESQQCRQILDLIVGFKISPILWQNIASNAKNSLSAGRCQTPALRLIYDNYKDIEAHPGKRLYTTTGYFTSKNLSFNLDYFYENDREILEFLEASKTFQHEFSVDEPKTSIRLQPSPLTTSALQQKANNELHTSPKETMKICQKLYEAGHITYMRTDSKIYSKDFIKTARDYIGSTYGTEYINLDIDLLSRSLSLNDNKLVQEAHEAIRPTDIDCVDLPNEQLTSKEIRMYKLIWNTTVESCMTAAKFKTVTANISAPDRRVYKSATELPIFLGWKIVQGFKENNDFAFLQTIKKGAIQYKKIIANFVLKDLKTHYTESKLVQLLEEQGIGRPSTFASLIDKIQERNYVKKENIDGRIVKCVDFELQDQDIKHVIVEKTFGTEKNKLVITPIGIFVLDFLLDYFDKLFDYNYTETMENALDTIAKGTREWTSVCAELDKEIIESIAVFNKTTGKIDDRDNKYERKSIKIDEFHSYIIGKHGPVIKCIEQRSNDANNDTNNDPNNDANNDANNDPNNDPNKAKPKATVTFKPVKANLDMDRLKAGEYTIAELVAETTEKRGRLLGLFENNEVYLQKGKFGLYITHGDAKYPVKEKGLEFDEISLDRVKSLLEVKRYFREINHDMSIRSSNYGDYVFYQTKKMKKPKFFKLEGFGDDYKTCNISVVKDWIETKYFK